MNLSHLSQTGEINNFQLFPLLHHDDIHSLSLALRPILSVFLIQQSNFPLFALVTCFRTTLTDPLFRALLFVRFGLASRPT